MSNKNDPTSELIESAQHKFQLELIESGLDFIYEDDLKEKLKFLNCLACIWPELYKLHEIKDIKIVFDVISSLWEKNKKK